ncbi:hypothetical protein C8Q78DRAFT_1083577 [Trametes maxima]|nr:hypothetical protein C8Q78DRAFT_1084039 [Trametes maxima]KAI0666030.1 hypothetical protein C8Q78DRAFT_1083577 [Trametes maxima]
MVTNCDDQPASFLFAVAVGACVSGLLAYLMLFKLSTYAILAAAGRQQSRTLKLIRRGLVVIPLEERKGLYERYIRMRPNPARGPDLFPAAPRTWCWLKAARILRQDAEMAFRRSEIDAIGRVLSDEGKSLLMTQP